MLIQTVWRKKHDLHDLEPFIGSLSELEQSRTVILKYFLTVA